MFFFFFQNERDIKWEEDGLVGAWVADDADYGGASFWSGGGMGRQREGT